MSYIRLDVNEGADGNPLLTIDSPETVIADFEWIEDGKAYREWLVPAEIINRFPVTQIIYS